MICTKTTIDGMVVTMTIDHRAALRILVEIAPELRRVGVESFSIDADGALRDVKLRPADPPMPEPRQDDKEPDVLDDPETFGGVVPKRRPLLTDRDGDDE